MMKTGEDNMAEREMLVRMLAGERLTEEEERVLEGWMGKEGNRREYYRMRMMQGAVLAEKVGEGVDAGRAWEVFRQGNAGEGRVAGVERGVWKGQGVGGVERVEGMGRSVGKEGKEGRGRRRLGRWVSWAAAVAVVVGAGLWVGLQERGSAGGGRGVQLVAEGGEVLEGQVVLMLSDGRQVALSEGMERGKQVDGVVVGRTELQERGGARIRQEGERLVYAAGDSVAEVVYNTLRVPRGAEFRLQLADGSMVWLNAGSELRYPVAFGGGQREVFLSGEAFFDVESDGAHPFVVRAEGFDVRVTGTEFNVRNYPEERASATLAEGRVEVLRGGESTVLAPGEQAVLHGEGVLVEVVDLEAALAWRRNAFCFKEVPLEELLNEIGRWYDLEVFYLNPSLKGLHFTAWFERSNSVEEVVGILEKTQRVDMELKGKTLIVKSYK